MRTSRLVVVGGFLGAGKTTLLTQAARHLIDRGYQVGVVTNDQGSNLVDSALLAGHGLSVAEVAGSCFCCAFPDLVEALSQLTVNTQPDIILAEPVGSCTDLVSTVLRPLTTYFPGQYEVAPLSVVADATRDRRTLSPNVAYLFERQLEEAEILLLNKVDLLDSDTLAQQEAALHISYPEARCLHLSAQTGAGVDAWLDIVLGLVSTSRRSMVVDYERYADAEAELAWLNVEGVVRASKPFSGRGWTVHLLDKLTQLLGEASIAHIKAHVTSPQATFKVSITQTGAAPSWDVETPDIPTEELDFTLNARVSLDPPSLQQAVQRSIEVSRPDPMARYYLTHAECFRPLPPRPTHRLTGAIQP